MSGPVFRRHDARAAVIAALLAVAAIALLPAGAYLAYLVVWLGVALAGAMIGIAPLSLARRGFVALPFVLAALPLVFTRHDELLWSGSIGGAPLTLSAAGLRILLSAAAKAWISVQISLLLVARHPIESIVASLRRLRLPDALATGIGLTVRYLDLLRDEGLRMLRARASRSASPAGDGRVRVGGSLLWRARVTGNLAGALFLRAYARATRIEEAAAARGGTGSLSSASDGPTDPRLAVGMAAAAFMAATIVAIGALLPRW